MKKLILILSVTVLHLFVTNISLAKFSNNNQGNNDLISFNDAITTCTPPSFTECPENLTVNTDAGLCSSVVNYHLIHSGTMPMTITYAFTGATTASGNGYGYYSIFNRGVTNVTITATNACGTATCNFTVTVVDAEPPAVTCADNINVSNDSGKCSAVVHYAFPTATDNCFQVFNGSQTFNYTGAEQTWTVPEGVTFVNIEAYGAQGGNGDYHGVVGVGGEGGYASGKLAVTPGQILYIYVGQQGPVNAGANRLTAFNGGGAGYGGSNGNRGSGGGASDVRIGGTSFTDRVIVAGGGGGAVSWDGGPGGGLVGGACTNNPNCGGGGTQTAGGFSYVYPGLFGLGGSNIASSSTICGGGGGYYGGGVGNAGGGGSGYIGGVYDGITTTGGRTGNGMVVINWSTNYTVQTAGLPSGSVFPTGTTTNTFLTTDKSGNTATCSLNVVVNDNELPAITCPLDYTSETDSGVCAYTVINPIKIVNKTYQISASNLVNLYEYSPVSYYNRFYDVGFNWQDTEYGNIISAKVKFSVGIECNNGMLHNTQFNGNNGPNFQTPYWCNFTGSSTPNNIVTMDLDTANYIAGATNSFIILNSLASEPWGLIMDTSLHNYFAEIYVTYLQTVELDPVFTDNCSGATVSYTLSGATTGTGNSSIYGTAINKGVTTVLWTVTDASSNTKSCSSTITILDKEPPSISFPVNPVHTSSATTCDGYATLAGPVTNDNCGVLSVINSHNNTADASGIYPVGTTPVTWIVTDISGNSDTAIQNIVVADVSVPAPDLSVLPNVTGVCSATATTVPSATDNCAGVVYGTTNDPLTYNTQGTHIITWRYDDGNGNINTQTQVVVITDAVGPIADIASLPDVTGVCSATVAATPTATDNCTNAITGTTTDPLTYNAQGMHIITWSYNDGNGNTTTQMQNVVITDNVDPVADLSTLPDMTGQCIATVSAAPTASDNCTGTITGTTSDPLTYYTQGTHIITWSFNDGNGNIITQNQNVIIDDFTVPQFTCPADLTICKGDVLSIAPSNITDNCAGTVVVTYSLTGVTTGLGSNDASNAVFNTGVTTVTYNFDDGNGNTDNCSFNVTINEVDTAVNVNMTTLIASGIGTYQWINCDNGQVAIDGATDQSFTPIQNGNYSVIVTQGSCSDTSSCIRILTVGIASVPADEIYVYPNPLNDELTIQIIGNKEKTSFEILNTLGQVVREGDLVEKTVVQTGNIPKGIYFIKLYYKGVLEFKKVAKE